MRQQQNQIENDPSGDRPSNQMVTMQISEKENRMKGLATATAPARVQVTAKQGVYQVASTTLEITTAQRIEFKTITEQIKQFVSAAPVRDGLVQISSLHTTAGLILNETQDALLRDMQMLLERIAPREDDYQHNDPRYSACARKNADAHLRALLTGHALTIPIEAGQLKLGTWQEIVFIEFDGPNPRKVHVQVMGV